MDAPSALAPPYLTGVRAVAERIADPGSFPFCLPVVRDLDVTFDRPVTIFVGENGSGKSTLLEAIVALCGLPVAGGSKAELASPVAAESDSPLAAALRPSFKRRPRDGYFLRAEFHAHFATLLDQRRDDPDFLGDPYAAYGGRSLHTRSHGEAFLAIIQHRFESGMFLLDEPESALSPQRQLYLLGNRPVSEPGALDQTARPPERGTTLVSQDRLRPRSLRSDT